MIKHLTSLEFNYCATIESARSSVEQMNLQRYVTAGLRCGIRSLCICAWRFKRSLPRDMLRLLYAMMYPSIKQINGLLPRALYEITRQAPGELYFVDLAVRTRTTQVVNVRRARFVMTRPSDLSRCMKCGYFSVLYCPEAEELIVFDTTWSFMSALMWPIGVLRALVICNLTFAMHGP